MTHLQFQAERYPIEAMSEALHRQRPLEETAMVSVPVWVVMEALQVVAEMRRETGDAHPDRAGMLDAVRRVMSSQGRAALEAAGLPSEPGVVRGERCEVRLWPADRAWSPIRDEHTGGEVRPVRLSGIHRYWAVTAQGNSLRFIVDGRWASADEASRASRGVFDRVCQDVRAKAGASGAVTFLEGMGMQIDGQWKGSGAWLPYAVVPVRPG